MDKFELAVEWLNDEQTRTFNMAAEKFGIETNEMIQLYAKFAESRKK